MAVAAAKYSNEKRDGERDPGRDRRSCEKFRQPARDLAGGARAAWPHHHLDREPAAGRRGVSAEHRGCAGGGADLRALQGAGDPVRHRHLARGPRQRAAGRRLDRFPRHEPDRGGACRGSRLRDRARRHPQDAERASARPGPVLPDRSRRRCLARRHGGDPRLRHQCGALRHHARQRDGAEGRARQWRGHDHVDAGAQILVGLRPDPADGRLRRHARRHHRADAEAARHSGSDRGGDLSVPVGRGGLQRHHPHHPVRHSGGAHRTARRGAGEGVQLLFEADAAGSAAAAAGVPRHRGGRRRTVAALRRDRGRSRWRSVRMDREGRRPHAALAGAPRRLLGGEVRCGRHRSRSRPMSACRSRGSPNASPRPRRI